MVLQSTIDRYGEIAPSNFRVHGPDRTDNWRPSSSIERLGVPAQNGLGAAWHAKEQLAGVRDGKFESVSH